MHHIKVDTDRLYVKRKVVGIGLLHTEPTHKAEINDIAEYLNTKYKYKFLNTVKSNGSRDYLYPCRKSLGSPLIASDTLQIGHP